MSVLLAMGLTTTTDDRGYILWLSQHWTVFVLPTLAFSALLIGFVVRKLRAWAAPTPGSSGPPDAHPQTIDPDQQGHPSSGSDAQSSGASCSVTFAWEAVPEAGH